MHIMPMKGQIKRIGTAYTMAGLGAVTVMLGSCTQARQTGTDIGTQIIRPQSQAKEVEAQVSLRAMLRGQQAYFMENGRFTESLMDLGLGLPQETEDYHYELSLETPAGQDQIVIARAIAQDKSLRNHTAALSMDTGGNTAEVMCQCKKPGESIGDPKLMNGQLQCGTDSEPIF